MREFWLNCFRSIAVRMGHKLTPEIEDLCQENAYFVTHGLWFIGLAGLAGFIHFLIWGSP